MFFLVSRCKVKTFWAIMQHLAAKIHPFVHILTFFVHIGSFLCKELKGFTYI